jgi:hypothetical protein
VICADEMKNWTFFSIDLIEKQVEVWLSKVKKKQ